MGIDISYAVAPVSKAGDTITGTLTLQPSTTGLRGLAQALVVDQWATGTVSSGTSLNQLRISADDIDGTNSGGSDYYVNGLTFEHYFGGNNARGGRQAFAAYLYLTATTNAASDNRNYAAVTGVSTAQAGDGGTDPSSNTTSKGAFFGGSLVGVAKSGATALLNLTGCEFNTAAQTGSSVFAKSLAQFCGRDDDAINGSGVDAMLWCYQQSLSSLRWRDGLLFADSADNAPFDSNSTVLRVGAAAIKAGIDMSAVTSATTFLKSPGSKFQVNGAGSILSALGTLAGSDAPLFSGTATWNDAAVTFSGIKLTVTNTASNSASTLLSIGTAAGGQFLSLAVNGVLSTASILASAASFIRWNGRSIFTAPADAQVVLTNSAQTSGIGLDVSADGVLSVRNRAQNADAIVQAASYKSGANQVVGARNTGWTAQTATPAKTDLGASPSVGQLAQWASAIQATLTTHGLIGA